MKPKILTVFLSFSLLLIASFGAKAALRVSISTTNSSGSFKTYTATDSVNTKFLLTPVYPDNIQYQILPQQACTINMHIVNASGVEVLAIGSKYVSYRLVNSISVASLPAGNYYLEFVSGTNNTKKYSIPFTIAQ